MQGISVPMSWDACERVKVVSLSTREERETDLATKDESSMLRIAREDFDDGLSDSSCSSCDCDVYHCVVKNLSVWSLSNFSYGRIQSTYFILRPCNSGKAVREAFVVENVQNGS